MLEKEAWEGGDVIYDKMAELNSRLHRLEDGIKSHDVNMNGIYYQWQVIHDLRGRLVYSKGWDQHEGSGVLSRSRRVT